VKGVGAKGKGPAAREQEIGCRSERTRKVSENFTNWFGRNGSSQDISFIDDFWFY